MSMLEGDVPFSFPTRLDLLVAGGDLIDLATARWGRYDVGVVDGRVVVVAKEVPRHLAAQVVDARGCLVLPGLVDLHTHIFDGATYWGVGPAPLAWRTGVTSWVDAGSAGAYNMKALWRSCAGMAPLRAKAFLNISAIGLVAQTGECTRDELCAADLCAATLSEHAGFLVGVKCRVDRAATGGMGLEPLRRAVRAAATAEVPVMVHIGAGPPDIDDVLDMLRPGDIVTHCMTGQGMSLLAPTGRPRPSAVSARERGVLFDVGHGSGSFAFSVAEAMLASGFPPDFISSDSHQFSVAGPCFDLPTCMAKFLALGMDLDDVVRAVTVSPALAIGATGAGSLDVGDPADLAIFEVAEGDFVLFDSTLASRRADRLLVNRATLVAGALLGPLAAEPPAPWVQLTDAQRALFEREEAELREPWAASFTSAECFTPWG
jgi:dihydroorotase